MKSFDPVGVTDPHDINMLFRLTDPQVYIDQVEGAVDFLDAKMKKYSQYIFNPKKPGKGIPKKKALRYDREIYHLFDWRSLDHPPFLIQPDSELTLFDQR